MRPTFRSPRGLALFAGSDEFPGHVPNQDCRVILKRSDGVQKATPRKEATLLFTGIADAGEDAKQVESDTGFVVMKLLSDSQEEVCSGQRRGNRRAQSQELLKRL
jgi:hypothetical protein